MPFLPTNLPINLQRGLEDFARNHDFAKLYKEYDWGIDSWRNGFPNILKLELQILKTAKKNSLKREGILTVAKWGRLRNVQRVKCSESLTLPLYEDDLPDKKLEKDPVTPLKILQEKIRGLGPTYLSKVLRFALPSEFGSIDTRIIRVAGIGDPNSKHKNWLSLRVRNNGFGWYIPKMQSAWPNEYSTWINILRFFAHFLNNSGESCPHPEGFLRNQLRKKGTWMCADIEMALFSYASKHLNAKQGELQ